MVNAAANFVVYSLMNRHLFSTILKMTRRAFKCSQAEPDSDRLPTASDSGVDTVDRPDEIDTKVSKISKSTKVEIVPDTCSELL